mmetsp:Transcript_24898/g.62633  ORF Transcript_24898/g.62633 Transcript_24898/m.62633 type:complete len:138 (-) Transcript_24898:1148-1561(-)
MKHEMEWLADDIQLVDKKKLRRPGNFAKTVPSDWSLRSYLQLLYAVESSKRTFDIFLQNKEVPCGLDSLFKVMKHKSKPYTKKFPIHYDAAVEGMEPGKEETARLVFGCVPKEAEDNNWCAAAPCSPAPQARVPSRA